MVAEQGTNQSVERAAAVLDVLSGGPLRVADVARRVNLGQSTTSRMLGTLEALDLVERDPVSSLYALGPALVSLAGAALNGHPVHRQARQPAQGLAGDLGLGVNVAVRRRSDLFYLCSFEGRLAPRASTLIGQRNPLHATGLGKCLLLGTSRGERRDLMPTLYPFTVHTVRDHAALDADLVAVMARGYATEVEELALGRACIAAPILGADGQVVAGISLSGSLSALSLVHRESVLAPRLIEVADAISVGLGYLGPRGVGVPLREAVR